MMRARGQTREKKKRGKIIEKPTAACTTLHRAAPPLAFLGDSRALRRRRRRRFD